MLQDAHKSVYGNAHTQIFYGTGLTKFSLCYRTHTNLSMVLGALKSVYDNGRTQNSLFYTERTYVSILPDAHKFRYASGCIPI